ncbi:hypothetical protein FIBSPDRAFT_805060 [Athelia psychrophila]|uniref:BTB domain-containing protein n=1 Tax=Athelia psychrophila TaxID=1759441 RepID=A0A167WNG4_9AGAM|nr:hypothetical protein FIBSPDRAFT_805060 [Fibularhizoctonia sp. CBS 109695]
MEPQDTADRVSDRFCRDDADITFRSCDGILFKVHRKNLEVVSEGFSPPEGTSSQSEIVPLTEDGATLNLLFQYMYPQRQPDLTKIDFKRSSELAEAAEKYQVYAAMASCNVRMELSYTEHSFEVMMYAFRHGYEDLMDKSQRKALEVSPTLAFESFTPQAYIAWTRYYAQWLDLIRILHKHIDQMPNHSHDEANNRWSMSVISQLDTPASLLVIEKVFDVATARVQNDATMRTAIYATYKGCDSCKRHIEYWVRNTLGEERRIKNLTTFL